MDDVLREMASGFQGAGWGERLPASNRAGEKHLFLLLLNAGVRSNQVNPFLGVLYTGGFEMKVLGWREEPEKVMSLLLAILEWRHSGQIGSVYFGAQLVLLVRFVN